MRQSPLVGLNGQLKTQSINYRRHFCVLEYPRSGGNWVLKLLSAYLRMPYRDLDRSPQKLSELIYYKIFRIPVMAYFNQVRVKNPFSYILKTHLFHNHRYRKIIYCVRDGRDVLASYYFYEKDFVRHHLGLNPQFKFNDDIPDKQQFENYLEYRFSTHDFPYQDWVQHVETAIKLSDNIVFVRFEDLKLDSRCAFIDLLHRINVDVDEERVRRVCEEHSFEREKERLRRTNPALCIHLRKGDIGSWREVFNDKAISYFQNKAGQLMKDLGFDLQTFAKEPSRPRTKVTCAGPA